MYSKKRNPYADKNYGGVLTLLQFLFIALMLLPRFVKIGGAPGGKAFGPITFLSKVPLRVYGKMTIVYVVMSTLNNMAFSFNISQPMHMVFRCSSLIVTVLYGTYIEEKKYSGNELQAVLFITLGAAAATFAESSMGDTAAAAASGGPSGSFSSSSSWTTAFLNSEASGGPIYLLRWWIGVGILVTVLFLQTLLGAIQNTARKEHGENSDEMLFYFHFLSLPAFFWALPYLSSTFSQWTASPSTAHELALTFGGKSDDYTKAAFPFTLVLELPIMWTHVLLNVITQYMGLLGVYGLIARAEQLTVNVALTVRKFASIIVSVLLFGNTFTTLHWAGTIFVFVGTYIFSQKEKSSGGVGGSVTTQSENSGTGFAAAGGGVTPPRGSAYQRGTALSTSSSLPSAPTSSASITTNSAALLRVEELPTTPFADQKPGTSGLRKKTKEFMKPLYLHNFVQATFDALDKEKLKGSTLVVSGDGRYWGREAVQIICKIAAGNGVRRVWVGKGGAFFHSVSPRLLATHPNIPPRTSF